MNWKRGIKSKKRETVICLIVRVDDILIANDELEAVNEIKQRIKFRIFEIEDIGEADYVIGIEKIYDRPNMVLTLQKGSHLKIC